MMQSWADFIDSLATGNVVPLHGAKAGEYLSRLARRGENRVPLPGRRGS